MAEPADPTPQPPLTSDTSSGLLPGMPNIRPTPRPPRGFFIAPPSLPSSEKIQYKGMPESTLTSEVESDVDEVIGQYREGNNLYYFARYKGGIAHKFPAAPFSAKYGDLIKTYERKKEEGSLAPFDPSASYVHPKSRVRMIVNISNKRATVNIKSARSIPSDHEMEVVPDSEEEQEDDDDNDGSGDEYGEGGSPIKSRRITRSIGKPVKNLPFSPRKTRSQKVFTIPDSDDEDTQDSEVEERGPTRRSTRTRKSVKVNLDADAYLDESELEGDESDGYSSTHKSKPKGKRPKKVIRGKASRPAYGHFRVVADIDYDSYSDEDSAPLREHRKICEKCHRGPAHELLEAVINKPKAKRKKKKTSDDEFEQSGDEQETLTALGGWVRCLKCPVTAHWRCLAGTQRDEILKAARERDRAAWRSSQSQSELFDEEGRPEINQAEPGKRPGLDAYQTTEFICGSCMKGGICMGCMEVALQPDTGLHSKSPEQGSNSTDRQTLGAASGLANYRDVEMIDGTQGVGVVPDANEEDADHNTAYELLYRCFTCKRLAHYAHLPIPQNLTSQASVADVAHYYQTNKAWLCADCSSYRYGLDRIIAWRPYPVDAVEPPRPANEPPHYKNPLPREYLVKWTDRSYRRIQWVPHMWLVSTNHAKLKNFLTGGTRVDLLAEALQEENMAANENHVPMFEITATESRDSSVKPGTKTPSLPLDATPDAERRIPPAWKTVDRILDVLLWYPKQRQGRCKETAKKWKRESRRRVDSEDDMDEDIDKETNEERTMAFDDGEQPSGDLTETVSDWEARTSKKFSMNETDRVVWAFIKWDDLGYDEATWDSPPRPEEFGYAAFETAFKRFINSRDVVVLRLGKSQSEWFDKRTKDEYKRKFLLKDGLQPDLGQNPQLKLMPFQVDGFNWLCNNWWTRQHCILADEMGLGKTVQIVTFIGNITAQFKAFPALVVVPNSTITNWVREFERWAPSLRVVPFYGEAKARDVIKKFELAHNKKRSNETGAKFHVLVTTYEALLNPKDFTPVFKNQPRWEVLVIDEGQRLKSDSSLLFRKLNELNSIHRIIMTGTPLNNNMRELFNLMNFLDPKEWHDLENLEKEHEELNEELVKELHNRLRPYFLRRIKSEVLQLPPKNEVIVPVSMAPLQKEVYRSILSHNLEILNGLTRPSGSRLNGVAPKGRINNVLMQLRKCLQHPYLYAEDIEPRGLLAPEAHDKLIDGSAKLRFLKALLPKLKARGHRVLLFSQFVIALDVIEDFLNGEGHRYLRLDGSTKGTDRQKGMDEFNRPGSEVFIYLLTTRAGGVGINLFSADTVIIFDPDFNPHQDLQAIARAHRYGQQKTCLVFKLMVKDSAEERIMQVGKKKLVLDHLIVQKMDDEDSAGENVQSILTYGAKALFESEQERDIIYTDQDIEKLIEKTEKEGEQAETTNEGTLSFSFAKIWAADKDSLEDVEDDDQGDSWAQTLQKITAEREKAQTQAVALSGRGATRAARRAPVIPKQSLYLDDSPEKSPKSNSKRKSKSKSAGSDGSAYTGSAVPSDEDSDSSAVQQPYLEGEKSGDNPSISHRRSKPIARQSNPNGHDNAPLSPIQNYVNRDAVDFCGLCDARHGDRIGDCPMTDKSENLAEFREMLILHAEDEPLDQRRKAIIAIDKTLQERGHISLIAGQPIRLVEKAPASANAPSKTKSKRAERSSGAQFRPHMSQVVMPTAGPSKRASSPLESKKKKARPLSSPPTCGICGLPFHIINDCPIVVQGPKSVSKEIKRLEQDPSMSGTVRILRTILSKQKKREAEEAQSHHSSVPPY